MRIRTGLAFGLLLASLSLSGCGLFGDDAASPDGDASSAPSEADPVAFAECMREHGIEMEDPKDGTGFFGGVLPEGTDPEEADAAMQACKHFLPNGGEPPEMDSEMQEKMFEFAQCMRDNGITDFPDPDPDSGGMQLPEGIDPEDPDFQAAQEACEGLLPGGGQKKEGP